MVICDLHCCPQLQRVTRASRAMTNNSATIRKLSLAGDYLGKCDFLDTIFEGGHSLAVSLKLARSWSAISRGSSSSCLSIGSHEKFDLVCQQ